MLAIPLPATHSFTQISPFTAPWYWHSASRGSRLAGAPMPRLGSTIHGQGLLHASVFCPHKRAFYRRLIVPASLPSSSVKTTACKCTAQQCSAHERSAACSCTGKQCKSCCSEGAYDPVRCHSATGMQQGAWCHFSLAKGQSQRWHPSGYSYSNPNATKKVLLRCMGSRNMRRIL